jgi:structure-specific recognition protein 1
LYDITLEDRETSVRGWNWGATDVRGADLAFDIGSKTAFEIPLRFISNSNIAGKTEVSLEFTNPDRQIEPTQGKKKRGGDELVEMRFYVPGTQTKDEDKEGDGDGDDEKSDTEEITAAQAFHDLIKEKADIGQVTGDGIVVFSEVLVLTPRGRYDIDMFPTFMRLRGKTYDYKIMYTSVTRLFLLPRSDEIHVQFIVGLDPPIRQGQTRYPFLVMLFSRDEEVDVELNMDEETINTKYEGKLQKKYEAPSHEVISAIFRALSGKKITGPAAFLSRDHHPGIKANIKAVQGELYFLDKSLIFVAKQPSLIDFADIHQVVFSRVGGAMATARTFDLKVKTKTGSETTFSSINKEEHESIDTYLKSKKVRVKNEMNDDILMNAVLSDEDEEMQSVASSGEERPQPRRMADDDESEDDEDFRMSDESDGGSPTSSSENEDEVMSDQSGDLEMVKAGKAQQKGGTGKKKKKAADADADGDADGAPKKPKKKKAVDGDADGAPKKPKKKAAKKKGSDGSGEDGPAKKKQKKD